MAAQWTLMPIDRRDFRFGELKLFESFAAGFFLVPRS